ncbi:hypothetical protein C2E23DRAFT_914187 [Lenzites betulinus]|nr:hypothetical protein C2E23DRAFT_914187 [Lenzites betulinus]
MSILPRKVRACVECAVMKVGCHQPADAEGPYPCVRCRTKGLCCMPRTNPPKIPCDECKDAHLGCDGLPEGPCTLCVRRGEACSFVGASESESASPAASTPTPTPAPESEYEREAGPAPSPPGSPSPTSEAMSPPPAPPPSPASDVDVSSACEAVVQPPLTRARFLDVVLRPPTP